MRFYKIYEDGKQIVFDAETIQAIMETPDGGTTIECTHEIYFIEDNIESVLKRIEQGAHECSMIIKLNDVKENVNGDSGEKKTEHIIHDGCQDERIINHDRVFDLIYEWMDAINSHNRNTEQSIKQLSHALNELEKNIKS